MPGIPARREPHDGSLYLSQIVGKRVSDSRRVAKLSLDTVAERMQVLGHTSWRRQTVAQVESATRNVTVDELIALAAALWTTVAFLLSPIPLGSDWQRERGNVSVDVGGLEPLNADALEGLTGFPAETLLHANSGYDWSNVDRPVFRLVRFFRGTLTANPPEPAKKRAKK
jgi:transcriptional regulator with XRE-family HTH domain